MDRNQFAFDQDGVAEVGTQESGISGSPAIPDESFEDIADSLNTKTMKNAVASAAAQDIAVAPNEDLSPIAAMPTSTDSAADEEENSETEAAENAPDRTSRSRFGIHTVAKRDKSDAEIYAVYMRRETKIEELRSCIFNKTVLLNSVTAVQEYNIKGNKIACLAFMLQEGIKVVIPYNMVYQRDAIDKSTVDTSAQKGRDELFSRQRALLDILVSAPIRWLPIQIIPDDDGEGITVLGSRTAALEIDRNTFYLSKNPIIQKGKVYRGRVVFARPHSVMVVLGGVERVIQQAVLTNRYATDMRELFKPGAPIPIAVRDLEIHGNNIKVDFDCISAEIIEAQENMKMIKHGDLTFATISKAISFTQQGDGEKRIRLYGWIDGWNVPCKISGVPRNSLGIPLKPGDKTRICVTGFDSEGYVTAFIRSVHNTYNL